MRKILLMIVMMFVSINCVFASDSLIIDVISVSNNSVTLKVKGDVASGDICYLYKSIDGVNYDNQIIVDCNKMYVDDNLELETAYYYKVRYGNSDKYSEPVSVILGKESEETLKLTRNVNELSFDGIGFAFGLCLAMMVLVFGMFLLKKKSI